MWFKETHLTGKTHKTPSLVFRILSVLWERLRKWHEPTRTSPLSYRTCVLLIAKYIRRRPNHSSERSYSKSAYTRCQCCLRKTCSDYAALRSCTSEPRLTSLLSLSASRGYLVMRTENDNSRSFNMRVKAANPPDKYLFYVQRNSTYCIVQYCISTFVPLENQLQRQITIF